MTRVCAESVENRSRPVASGSAHWCHPNVLHLIFDDLRPDLGAYGHKWAHTPHLDALVREGIELDRHYTCEYCPVLYSKTPHKLVCPTCQPFL